MPKAQVEYRTDVTGFVYTSNTRMLFAPKHTATRKIEDRESTDLMMTAAARWPEPSRQDVAEMRAAMVKAFPDRKLFVDTSEGLVPVYEPAAPRAVAEPATA